MNSYIRITYILVAISSLILVNNQNLVGQTNETSDFSYQINRVQKYVSISPQQLVEAKVLSDLNHYYKSDWVKEYKSVITSAKVNGKRQEIESKDSILTTAQKSLIHSADKDTDIEVVVQYLPENNFAKNPVTKMDFSFRIDPEVEAKCIGGKNQLDKYITSNIMEAVSIDDIPQYQVAAVKFVIDEEGRVVDAHIAQASKNKEADQLMLKTVCDMPNWQAAAYADGTKTKQEFVLTIGDHFSCTMNTLDIKSEVPPSTLTNQ